MTEVYIGDEQSRGTIDCSLDGMELVRIQAQRKISNRIIYALGTVVVLLVSAVALLLGLNGFFIDGNTSTSTINNDKCSDALELRDGDAPIEFTTVGASVKDDMGITPCGMDLEAGPGVWFRVDGTGFNIRVIKDDKNSFTHQMSIYQGPHCGELTCITGDDLRGSASFNTKMHGSYFIRVNGVSGAIGDFKIHVENIPHGLKEPATNDICEESIGLNTDGSFVYANTGTATLDKEGAGSCYKTSNAGSGVWYDVMGSTSGSLLVTTNTSDVMLAVYQGDCDNLQCVGASDMMTGVPSLFQWTAEANQRYFILAHSVGDSQGVPFDISAISEAPDAQFVLNDFCKGAIGPVAADGSILRGSTNHASLDRDGAGSCYASAWMGTGVWYSVKGTGDILKAFPSAESEFKPLISVFQGSCRKLKCVENASHKEDYLQRSILSWKSEVDEIYYLLIRGPDGSRGDFEIIVESNEFAFSKPTELQVAMTEEEAQQDLLAIVSPALNDFCDSATLLPPSDTLTKGSTANATNHQDDVNHCHSAKNAGPGVWYRVIGNGNSAKASITSNSTLDAFISVYTGDCEDLYCVADANGEVGAWKEMRWKTIENEAYFILVQGHFGQYGDFELQVNVSTSVDETTGASQTVELDIVSSNDNCADASGISSSENKVITGSTAGIELIQEVKAGSCSNSPGGSPGLWYTIVGSGGKLHVSTRSLSNVVSAGISVFSGICENLACIAGTAGTNSNSISWDSQIGTVYQVYVYSPKNATGAFELRLNHEKAAPEPSD